MKCFNNYIVDGSRIRRNGENIKKLLGDRVKYCAVIKANAYGCGIETACRNLKGVADYFACACIKEALEIRLFDKSTKVLILGVVDIEDLDIISNSNISISVGSIEQLEYVVSKAKKRINIHLQINTGLNRFGLRSIKEFTTALKIIDGCKFIHLEGVYSHFATKQSDRAFVHKQYLRFLQFRKRVQDRDVICHISNSYATLNCDKYRLDMVRVGYLTYGYQTNKIGNLPVVSITTRIVSILNVKRGDTIGYDRTFRAHKNIRVAVIPIGYADGLNRRLSNKFHVLIRGVRCKIIGMICMDVAMVDITEINVKIGERVVILGSDGNDEIAINDMSDVIGTSPYEVICNFRYKRMNYIVK